MALEPPLPAQSMIIMEELRQARRKAADMSLVADRAEAAARKARRRANGAEHHYEQLLLEHNGQLKLFEEGSS